MQMEGGFLSATVLLFLVLDPFGNMPLAVALLRSVPRPRRWRVVLRECVIAYAVLMLFLLFGGQVMHFLQLSQTSLGIAGGGVLLLIALRMIFPEAAGAPAEADTEPLIVPLAIPAIAGPSAMAIVMLMASSDPQRLWDWAGAVTLAMLASTTVLVAGGRIIDAIGERGAIAMARLTGLLLTAIAVEMLLGGVRTFITSL